MGAAIYTPDEERRYKLAPLPEVDFIGQAAAERLHALYEAHRHAYRTAYPVLTREELESMK